jgi:outer membrane lipoprotein SlyB
MKTNYLGLPLAAAALLVLTSCANMTPQEKKLTGQIAGGVTGAALGSLVGGGTGRIVAAGAGAVLGTIVGGNLADR